MIIHIANHQKIMALNRRQIRQDLQAVLKNLLLKDKEVSLVFMDDNGIQDINKVYLHRDWPTNVISFAIADGQYGDVNPGLLGDIVISTERALYDSREADIPFADELAFLLIHGLLHLVGYEHEGCSENEAMRMQQKEQELFFALRGYHLDLG